MSLDFGTSPELADIAGQDDSDGASAAFKLGRYYQDRGSFDTAIQWFEKAKEKFHELGDFGLMAECYYQIVRSQCSRDPENRHTTQFQQAYLVARTAGRLATAGAAMISMAQEFAEGGAKKTAEKFAREGIYLLNEYGAKRPELKMARQLIEKIKS